MPTTGTGKAKAAEIKEGGSNGGTTALPRSATIKIRKGDPRPSGKVEVTPWTGRVRFVSYDKKDYRLRFYKPGTNPLEGIDILLSARGSVTVLIKQGDEFFYNVIPTSAPVELGRGGGPIVN